MSPTDMNDIVNLNLSIGQSLRRKYRMKE